jgi:hypothetical protein
VPGRKAAGRQSEILPASVMRRVKSCVPKLSPVVGDRESKTRQLENPQVYVEAFFQLQNYEHERKK